MISFYKGDIFASDVWCIAQGTNLAGKMGRGFALEIKKRYPLTYQYYVKACKEKRLILGGISACIENNCLVINLGT